MSSEVAVERPVAPTWAGRCLGWFVTLQLLAIPLGSYIKIVPVRLSAHRGEIPGDLQAALPADQPVREPYQTVVDGLAWALARWSEVTGQGQYWALFTSFSDRVAFPVVELAWPDRPTVRLTCHFEPADPTRYFYPPEPRCRLWNYEYRTVVFYLAYHPEKMNDPAEHRRELIHMVGNMRRSTLAYLNWKSKKYLDAHPELPLPASVTLIARVHRSPAPGQSRLNRPEIVERPMARWEPALCDEPGFVPFEIWDPVQGRFARVALSEVP